MTGLAFDITRCFGAQVGPSGLGSDAWARALDGAAEAMSALRAAHDGDALRFLRLPDERADLPVAEAAAKALIQGASDVMLLGTGGSSLGTQAVAALAGHGLPGPQPQGPRFHFFDNLDGGTFADALARLDPATTRIVAVSKSGTTGETMMQAEAVAAAWGRLGERCAVITEPKPSALRRFGERHGAVMLEHDPRVGGRFSVLTLVGLFPAMLMGLDASALRAGAADALAPLLEGRAAAEVPSAAGAAVMTGLESHGITELVLWPYGDRLAKAAMWWRQLWGESLGKDGQGTAPHAALGPVDQHSQLQLYLAGPRNKAVTIITHDGPAGPRLPATLADADLAWAEGRAIGELVACQARATADTLAKNGVPVRTITSGRLDERALGHLFTHFMLETVIAASILGVDPYDQPAVEEGKVLARRYLAALPKG